MAWMVGIGASYVLASSRVLGWFGGGELVELGAAMLAISALWQVFDAVSITLSETLRAAGDTAWIAFARIALAWAVFVPSAYLVVRVWHGGALGAMWCLVGYIAVLSGLLAWRFRSGAWKRIELIDPAPPPLP